MRIYYCQCYHSAERKAGSLHQTYRCSPISAMKLMTICSTASSTTVIMYYIISFLHRQMRHNTTLCDPGDTSTTFCYPYLTH